MIAPVERPEISVLGPLEELIDELRALVWIFVGEESTRFVGRRDQADDVKVSPAKEGGVIRQTRRRNFEGLELGEDVIVDEIVRNGRRHFARLEYHVDFRAARDARRAYHDGGFSAALRREHALGSDLGDGIVVGLELGGA